MEQNFMNQYNNQPEEQDVDLVELIQRMWINRGLIVKVTIGFMVFGLLIAIFSSKVYTASCDVVPQTSESTTLSRMSSLAAMAGINLNQMQDVKTLSPYVYENITKSTTFYKELMQTNIFIKEVGHPISFYEYYTSEEYNKPSILEYILKYTIGLPGVILKAIRGDNKDKNLEKLGDDTARIETVTEDEYNCMKMLNECVSLTLDDKKGYVTITANMPEALAAAQMAQATVTLLQKYITEFKIEKVQSNLDFVQERYDEAKRNFEDIQARRAKFRDANLNTTRYSARTELDKLDAEYSLAMNLYSELATQLEQAKIKVKETIPVLTIINPVTVPFKKSKPQRAMILMAFTFLGVVAGMGCVLLLPTVADITGSEKIRGWVKPLPEKEQPETQTV
ncbi:MAG: lipopolysaccharide biosynthesis protein [Alistipes sp.]|nr:lipopolysaccharide biosynthesis protein [Alistipes sp.]MBO5331930.1 lipopolysaccharide biosynthesis protein [Alistipes sp.]